MELAGVTAKAVLIIFIYMVVGFIAGKVGVLTKPVSDGATKVLVSLCCPALVLGSFFRDYNPQLVKGIFLSAAFASAYFLIGLMFGFIFIRRQNKNCAVARICIVFQNYGFVGLPLTSLIFGSEGVVYGAIHLAVFQFFFYTFGIMILSGKFNGKSFLNCFKSPGIVCAVIGAIIFSLRIPVPEIIQTPISAIGNCATPLGMIIAGGIIARSDMRPVLKNGLTYVVAFLKLLMLPFCIIGLTKVFNIPDVIAVTAVISAACPQANYCNVYSELYGKDSALSSGIFSLCTLLCIITIPVVVALYGII